MTVQTKNILKTKFETGDKPNQSDYFDLIDSSYNDVGVTSLPDQTGNDGKVLTTNGTSASWTVAATGGGTSIGINSTNIIMFEDYSPGSCKADIAPVWSIPITAGCDCYVNCGFWGNYYHNIDQGYFAHAVTADQQINPLHIYNPDYFTIIDIFPSLYLTILRNKLQYQPLPASRGKL